MKQLPSIDGLRAIAILSVVLMHAGYLNSDVNIQRWTLWGAHGVDLFFIISGFCLSFQYLVRRAHGDTTPFDRRTFAYARAYRLLPAYYGSLFLFWLLSATPFGWPDVFARHFSAPTLTQYLAYFGLVYEDPIHVHTNVVYWTLAIELRWYVLFPFVLSLYTRSRAAFAAVAAVAYLDYWHGPTMIDAGTLPCFMLGIVAADLYAYGALESDAWRVRLPALTVCAFLAAAAAQAGYSVDHGELKWQLIPFAFVCAGLGGLRRLLSWTPLVFIGRASYSIYLVHFPIMMSLAMHRWGFFMIIVGGICAGVVFYALVERPAQAFCAKLKRAQFRSSALQVPAHGHVRA